MSPTFAPWAKFDYGIVFNCNQQALNKAFRSAAVVSVADDEF